MAKATKTKKTKKTKNQKGLSTKIKAKKKVIKKPLKEVDLYEYGTEITLTPKQLDQLCSLFVNEQDELHKRS